MNELETYLVEQLRTAQKAMKSGEIVEIIGAIECYIDMAPNHKLPKQVLNFIEDQS